MTEMVDLKRSKKDLKERNTAKPSIDGGDQYPYGLNVDLDHDSLDKLGMTDSPPKVGSKVHLHAHAHVKSHDITHDEHGKPRHRISLQLQKMAVDATKKASEQEVHEGNLRGAKAAMDKALDSQEGPDSDD